MTTTIETTLAEFLEKNFVPRGAKAEIGFEQDLFATGVLDSAGVLFLITWLETEFGVRVPDEDLVPAHFSTIASVAAYLEPRLNGRGKRGSS